MADSKYPRLFAFVDESGTNALNTEKDGVSKFFICAAVIIEEKDLESARERLLKIRKGNFFQGKEIKSKTIGGKAHKRIEVLSQIMDIDFRYIAQIIDKERIYKDSGLQYKKSFYKFINRMLYSRLSHTGLELQIIADGLGNKDFMDSFDDYLAERVTSFLSPVQHDFADSKEEPLIQLADIIAGSLAYCFEPSKQSDRSSEFHQLLKTKELEVTYWPLPINDVNLNSNADDEKSLNDKLQYSSLNRAQSYIDKYRDNKEYQLEVATLRRLLYLKVSESDANKQWQYRGQLIKHLEDLGKGKIKSRQFTTKIIGRLRSKGILISSSQQKGYCLVTTLNDFRSYIYHDQKIIIPMLKKLIKGRNAIKQDVKIDIMDSVDFIGLKSIVDNVEVAETGSFFGIDISD